MLIEEGEGRGDEEEEKRARAAAWRATNPFGEEVWMVKCGVPLPSITFKFPGRGVQFSIERPRLYLRFANPGECEFFPEQ